MSSSGRMLQRDMTRGTFNVAMGMAQLTGRCSLRDIVESTVRAHLGVGVVTRSSLARVNQKPWEMYEELHGRLAGALPSEGAGTFTGSKPSTRRSLWIRPIDLCLSAVGDRTKGAVKVHVGLDHEGYHADVVELRR